MRTLEGVTTILSSPKRAMSPLIVLTNSQRSFTALLMFSMLLFAKGVTLSMRILPDATSFFIVSRSERLRRGMAFK